MAYSERYSLSVHLLARVFSDATVITSIDANYDGHMDMLLASCAGDLGDKKLQLLINNGNGDYTDATELISDNVEAHIGWVGVADFDDDGKMYFWTTIAK